MALSIAPSQFFRGNDGPSSGGWSTFNVLVGTGPQQMEVLPATSMSEILVVIQEGCPDTDPSGLDCQTLRGQLFNATNTSDVSWARQFPPDGQQYFEIPFFSEEVLPNYDANAEAGFDTVALDWSGDSVPHALYDQVVLGYAATYPWLGLLGINGRPSHMFNATTSENSPLQSLLQNKSISGLYWAYTAGTSYTSPPTFGSLTFGGYDAGRFDNSSVITVPFSSDSSLDLLVALKGITISGTSNPTVNGLDPVIYMFIDSVVPEIWLPLAACVSFEEAFGLTWNDTFQMYLVNDTQHSSLVSQGASVTFTLAGAFDLTATFPLVNINDSTTRQRYFPLKRAANDSQYFLGRTFLQEAYLMVDYNASEFKIAKTWKPALPVQIVEAYPPRQRHTNVGLIAGVAVGAVVLVAVLAGVSFWWWRRRKNQARPKPRDNDTLRTRSDSVGDTTIVGDVELDNRSSGHAEYFKPLMEPSFPDEDYIKPELDATETATTPVGRGLERHELEATGFRPVHKHQTSWGSNGSGSMVSPISEEQRRRSMLPHPSPPMHPSGSPSPPLSGRHSRQLSGDLFEMP